MCIKVCLFASYEVFERRSEDEIACIASDGSFVLSPEERPVVIVLEMVRMPEEDSWGYIAWYEREICPVVAVENLLRTGCSDSCDQ